MAAECVVLAETKDHLNWELIGELAKKAKGEQGSALKEAHEEVEDEEDEHLYHTTGWTRELWIEALGMPAVLPPPEEEKHVKTAIGAARAKLPARTCCRSVHGAEANHSREPGGRKALRKAIEDGTVHRHSELQARPR